MSLTKIFVINLILGLLASAAHVGGLVLYIYGVPGSENLSLFLFSFLATVDLVLIFGALVALVGGDLWKSRVLPIHAVVLGLVAAAIFGWLLKILLVGFPEGSFGWTPGFGAALVGYGVMLSRRAFYKGQSKHMLNAGWYAAGITFVLELLLMYRFYVEHFT